MINLWVRITRQTNMDNVISARGFLINKMKQSSLLRVTRRLTFAGSCHYGCLLPHVNLLEGQQSRAQMIQEIFWVHWRWHNTGDQGTDRERFSSWPYTYKSRQNFLGMWRLGLAFFVLNMRWWSSGICLEESQGRYSSRAEWIRKAGWLSVNHLTLLKNGPFWQVVDERKWAEGLHGWTRDLWLNSDEEKEAHKWWKKDQETPWDYIDTIQTCRV